MPSSWSTRLPFGLLPSSHPETLFTTRKFSMVFPLAKTTSPVSFTASGRISFTSWPMTPGEGQTKCVLEGKLPTACNGKGRGWDW